MIELYYDGNWCMRNDLDIVYNLCHDLVKFDLRFTPEKYDYSEVQNELDKMINNPEGVMIAGKHYKLCADGTYYRELCEKFK